MSPAAMVALPNHDSGLRSCLAGYREPPVFTDASLVFYNHLTFGAQRHTPSFNCLYQ